MKTSVSCVWYTQADVISSCMLVISCLMSLLLAYSAMGRMEVMLSPFVHVPAVV